MISASIGLENPPTMRGDVRLVVVADFRQIEMQQVLAGIVERTVDAVAVRGHPSSN